MNFFFVVYFNELMAQVFLNHYPPPAPTAVHRIDISDMAVPSQCIFLGSVY